MLLPSSHLNSPFISSFLVWWFAACCWLGPTKAEAGAFWVWHRDTPLAASEVTQLLSGQCDALYWHVGMVGIQDGQWVGTGGWLAPATLPSSKLRCVPVLRGRLEGVRELPTDHTRLLRLLQRALERWQANEIQLDFDCPDRLLPDYIQQLAACRAALRPARLSITALAGWAGLPVFPALQSSVDELFPMFYDLSLESPAGVQNNEFLPLLDRVTLARQLSAWSKCTTPWRAGLPCFARISLFAENGRSKGHFRSWPWDEVTFHGGLKSLPVAGPGLALFAVRQDTSLHQVALLKGERLVTKLVEPDEAKACSTLAMQAGAGSVCWFRLPSGSASSGWSLAQALALSAAPPEIQFRLNGETLVLENASSADLRPRLNVVPGATRGWQIELEEMNQQAVFREVKAGDFFSVHGHISPEAARPQEVSIPLATRLTFWLGELKAQTTRRSGIFSVAPGTKPETLRWRLLGQAPLTDWRPLAIIP